MIISYSLFAPCEVLWTLTRAEGAAGWPRVASWTGCLLCPDDVTEGGGGRGCEAHTHTHVEPLHGRWRTVCQRRSGSPACSNITAKSRWVLQGSGSDTAACHPTPRTQQGGPEPLCCGGVWMSAGCIVAARVVDFEEWLQEKITARFRGMPYREWAWNKRSTGCIYEALCRAEARPPTGSTWMNRSTEALLLAGAQSRQG